MDSPVRNRNWIRKAANAGVLIGVLILPAGCRSRVESTKAPTKASYGYSLNVNRTVQGPIWTAKVSTVDSLRALKQTNGITLITTPAIMLSPKVVS